MYIVTGAAGFIGSNLVRALNERGFDNILLVDNLSNGKKIHNLVGLKYFDYIDKHTFLKLVQQVINDEIIPHQYKHLKLEQTKVIFHQGACSTTTEWDGVYMFNNNYEYSKQLLFFAEKVNADYIYASSAAVYGNSKEFKSDDKNNEKPINVYGYSKLAFDNFVRNRIDKELQPKPKIKIVGLRYFNVFGPYENHKGPMASVPFHIFKQIKNGQRPKLFGAYDGYEAGEQMRDFIYIKDVVQFNLWAAFEVKEFHGVVNLGTGEANSFNTLATACLTALNSDLNIEYINFPEHLKGVYQSYTQSDMSENKSHYRHPFTTLETAIKEYMDFLSNCKFI